MPTDAELMSILKDNKTVAVYGMSRDIDKPANSVPAFLSEKGYHVIPINPNADSIMGLKSYPDIASIPGRIDILDVFRPAQEAAGIVKEALTRRAANGDIKIIWLQEGIVNSDAEKLAVDAGLTFVQDRCMKKEYLRLFSDGSGASQGN